MSGHALHDIRCSAEVHEPGQRRVSEVVEAQRFPIGEGGDLIADRMPAHSAREVAGIERASLDPGEDMIEVVRGQPRLQLGEDWHRAHAPALGRALNELAVAVRGERATNRQQPCIRVHVRPSKADQLAKPQPGVNEASKGALPVRSVLCQIEHPRHLNRRQSACHGIGVICLRPSAGERPAGVRGDLLIKYREFAEAAEQCQGVGLRRGCAVPGLASLSNLQRRQLGQIECAERGGEPMPPRAPVRRHSVRSQAFRDQHHVLVVPLSQSRHQLTSFRFLFVRSALLVPATTLVVQSRQRLVIGLRPLTAHRLADSDSFGTFDPLIEVIEGHSLPLVG
ncbi:hypothetical protein MRBLWO12_000206 [Microbacterium sp. LWO12-1.2]